MYYTLVNSCVVRLGVCKRLTAVTAIGLDWM